MPEYRLTKKSILKDEFNKVVDSSFKSLVDQNQVEEETDDINEVFRLYDKFYYEIPVEGETNSHEYLASRSGELIKVDTVNVEIQPLIDEITELRETILQLQQNNAELDIEISNIETNNASN